MDLDFHRCVHLSEPLVKAEQGTAGRRMGGGGTTEYTEYTEIQREEVICQKRSMA